VGESESITELRRFHPQSSYAHFNLRLTTRRVNCRG